MDPPPISGVPLPVRIEFEHFLPAVARADMLVGPCLHGMARPRVADREMASDKEGSCE